TPSTGHFHHPVVGDPSLAFEATELSADTGFTLTAYTAEPDTPSHDGVKLLASWAAPRVGANRTTTSGIARPSGIRGCAPCAAIPLRLWGRCVRVVAYA
ncbi:MAG: hypothetical protein ABWY20_16110, partial [Mycobacterium sp.]